MVRLLRVSIDVKQFSFIDGFENIGPTMLLNIVEGIQCNPSPIPLIAETTICLDASPSSGSVFLGSPLLLQVDIPFLDVN